jgi:hypothetical protein
LDRKVTAQAAKLPIKNDPAKPVYIATYVGPDGIPTALCLTDLSFACHSGSALSMLPAAVSEESVRKVAPSDAMMENYAEIMNVFSSALAEGAARIKLRGTPETVDGLAPDARAIAKRAKRAEFDVEIHGYGIGKLAILVSQ